MVMPEVTSHPMTDMLALYAWEDMPTKLLAFKFVSNKEPAMIPPVRLRPPRK